MKYLFAVIFFILAVASFGVYWSYPDMRSDVPVIYWVTDNNDARDRQVAVFHEWLIKNGHVNEDGEPIVKMRLDVSNSDTAKKMIQSVSGVGGDVIDIFSAHDAPLFHQSGVMKDVTEEGLAMGFDPGQTYPAIKADITVDGRQYLFPCNVTVLFYWINLDTFESVGMQPPPMQWTLEEFEAMGKEFMRRANPPGTRPGQRRFFASDLHLTTMHRSLGLSAFNETMTASTLGDPRYAQVLKLKRKWIYEDNFLPSPDDTAAFSSQQGFGGPKLSLFGAGNYAMVDGGRWFLIRMRQFKNPLRLQVAELPHGGYRNTTIGCRSPYVYAGSPNPELAVLFLAYLASEDYNALIVDDGDSLPPNPKYTNSEAFLRPPKYPNEWGTHGEIVRMAGEIAIPAANSPFVLVSESSRITKSYYDDYIQGKLTAEQAGERTAAEVNEAIADEILRKPELKPRYEQAVQLQKQIEARLAAGEKVPAEWISNPFYLQYYRDKGLVEEPAESAPATATAPDPS